MTDTHDRPSPDPVGRLDDLGAALAERPPLAPTPVADLRRRADARTRRRRGLAAVAALALVGALAAGLAWADSDDATRVDVGGQPSGPPTTHAPPVDDQLGVDAEADPMLLAVEDAVGATVSITIRPLSSTLVDPRAVAVERWDGERWVALADVAPTGSLDGAPYEGWFAPGSLPPADVAPVPVPRGDALVLAVVLPDGAPSGGGLEGDPLATGAAPLGPGWYRLSVGLLPLGGEPDGPLPVPLRAAVQLHVVPAGEVLGADGSQDSTTTALAPATADDGAAGCGPTDVACRCAQRVDRWAEGTDVVAFLMPEATDEQAADLQGWLAELEARGGVAQLSVQTPQDAYAELVRTFADQPQLVESLAPEDLPTAYQLAVDDPQVPATVAQWVVAGPVHHPTVQVVVVGQPNPLCDDEGQR